MNYCADIDRELEGLHCETDPESGSSPAATSGLMAADRVSIFKTRRKGIEASSDDGHFHGYGSWTIQPKWHLHLSLSNADGENIFYDPTQVWKISPGSGTW